MKLGRKRTLFAIIALLAATATAAGTDADPCTPARDSRVDESVFAAMLGAAGNGYLYRIQPSSSQVGFCVDSPLGRVEGRFRDFRGGLTFAAAAPGAGEQQAVVRVETSSLETGAPLIEGMLKGERFFDVDQYPEMLFVSRHFRWVSDSEAILIGDLTLRGVTRRVGFVVRLIGEQPHAGEQRIRVKATTLISREAFGLDALSPAVSDLVSLCLSVEAVRYRAT